MTNPRQYKIPDWFLNRQKDIVDGKYAQVSTHLTGRICWNDSNEVLIKISTFDIVNVIELGQQNS